MISQESADAIKEEVRAFYAYGVKTSNKVYVDASQGGGMVAYNDPFEGKWQTWTTRMMAAKAKNRNRNVALSAATSPGRPKNTSVYTWGKSIYNGGERSIFSSGNCVEMTAVAAVLAIDRYSVASNAVYIAMIRRPGDHVFCVVSSTKPTWPKVAAMRAASGSSGAFVIDPWLNAACPAESYFMAVYHKVSDWGIAGKRVCWTGPDGNALGWYDPRGRYFEHFMESELVSFPATLGP